MSQGSIRQCYSKSEDSNYYNTDSDRKQPGSYKMAVDIVSATTASQNAQKPFSAPITRVTLEFPRNEITGVNSIPRRIKDVKNHAFHEHITSTTVQEMESGLNAFRIICEY